MQAQIDAGDRTGITSTEADEIESLKAENKQLREDVAILKAATTFREGMMLHVSTRVSGTCPHRVRNSLRHCLRNRGSALTGGGTQPWVIQAAFMRQLPNGEVEFLPVLNHDGGLVRYPRLDSICVEMVVRIDASRVDERVKASPVG